jgi:glycosyltransferase
VSVITVAYNSARTIRDCILSVQGQSYPNIEHIVIDGGSTDGTADIVRANRERIAYFVSERDGGIYHALNKGVRQATGDLVCILHSDDLFHTKDSIAEIVAEFRRTGVDLVYANVLFVSRDRPDKVRRNYVSSPFSRFSLRLGWIPCHTSICVKRQVYDTYGLYDESYSISSDYEISLRWFTNESIRKTYLNRWVVNMRLGGKSTTARLQKHKSLEDLRIIRKYGLWGWFTLLCKIVRKIPQFVMPCVLPSRRFLGQTHSGGTAAR